MDYLKMLDGYEVSVRCVSDPTKGRGLVSKCGFSKGSTVTIQDPICHAVRSNWHDKLCSTCFKELEKLPDDKSRCSRCHYNHYCNTDWQLYLSYTDLLEPKHMRQEFLRYNYHFTCDCPRCSEDSELDLFLDCLLCLKCRCSALAPKAVPPEGMGSWFISGIEVCSCEDSSIVVDASSVGRLLTEFEQLSQDHQPADKSSLDKWLKFQTKASAVLSPLHFLSIRVKDKIMGAAFDLQDWEKAYTTAKELEKFYELFLQPSPLYSLHLVRLLKFCSHCRVGEEGNSEQTQLFAKMVVNLMLTHGPAHNLCKQIFDRANRGSS